MNKMLNLIQHIAIILVVYITQDIVVAVIMIAGMLAAFYEGMNR